MLICKSQSSLSSILLHPRWSWRRSREKDQECRQPQRPSWTKDTTAPLSPPRWTLSGREERRQSSLKNLTTWTRKGWPPRGTCIPSNCRVFRSRSLSEWTPVLRISARSRSVQTPWKEDNSFCWLSSPVLLDCGAYWDRLMAPNIPTWSTSDLSSETFFDANSEVVIFIFHTWVLRQVLFYVLGRQPPHQVQRTI